MTQFKEAAVSVLAHETASVTASQQLPDVDAAHTAGARSVIVQNIGLGEALWLTLDESEAAVDAGIKIEPSDRMILTLDDVRKARVFAASPCKVGVTYYR